MSLTFEARTDTGKKREHNEDSFFVNMEDMLFIVADGMGGQAAGETASSLAVRNVDEFIRMTREDADITWPIAYNPKISRNGNRLEAAVRLAHRKIYEYSLKDIELGGMGTTIVSALFNDENKMTFANVGDSRLYVITEDSIHQLTNDHSWVNEQVKLGLLTEDQAKNHPYRNVVTRALGGKDEFEVDIDEIELEDNNIVLLCTDGLTTMIKDSEIAEIAREAYEDMNRAVDKLIEQANKKGGEDNITVILIRYNK